MIEFTVEKNIISLISSLSIFLPSIFTETFKREEKMREKMMTREKGGREREPEKDSKYN